MMAYAYGKKWEMDFAGVLGENYEISRKTVILNSNDTLQFYIKIISNPPENFPRHVREITGYGDALADSCGFYDDTNLDDDTRKEKLRDFLNRYILFFNVEQRGEFFVGKDWHIVRKTESFRTDTILEPVPIFSEDAQRTQEIFEEQLRSKKFIGVNKQVSTEHDDTPPIILWKSKSKESGDAYTVYGPISNHDYAFGGFRFNVQADDSPIKKISLDKDVFLDSYLHEQVLFISSTNSTEIQAEIESDGETLETIEYNHRSETFSESNIEHSSVNEVKKDKEEDFMNTFKQQAKLMGLYYEDKDFYNFHTAMKTKGLVILSGMSGTGKSKLVQCYAKAMVLKKGQLAFIPVRPSWQDDTDVIGYLDTLNNVYRPGDSGLINTLIQAQDNPDNLYIVCFDEMNLARVEHYFSQFLSVLEQEGNTRELQLYNPGYETRLYNQNEYKPNLLIGNNVLFVGTVNLDESTYQFSDKVLDRSNVISLNVKSYEDVLKMEEDRRMDLSMHEEKNAKENPVTTEIFESFRKKGTDITLTSSESKLLWEIHRKLQECNRNIGIGWRIVRQIDNYLNNLPSTSLLKREEAFDLQLIQRVLTKVRGSEEQFSELIGRYNPDLKEVEHSTLLDLLDTMPSMYSMEKTRRAIKDKARELRLYGHTI